MPSTLENAPRHAAGLACIIAVALLAACSTDGIGSLTSIAGYQAANAVMPVGHSYKPVGERQYQVSAAGTAQTPRERVEKIATARAAEIGIEQRLPYFKVLGATAGLSCTEQKAATKIGHVPAFAYPTVTLDVVYSKTADDPQFRPSADTFNQLKGELDTEVVPPEQASANMAAAKSQCGQKA